MDLSSPSQPRGLRRFRIRRTLVWTVLFGLVVAAVWVIVGDKLGTGLQRTPMELVRYAQRRLEGHPKLEAVFLPALGAIRSQQEREPPAGLPSLGKGQQARSLEAPQYDSIGRPLPAGTEVSAGGLAAPAAVAPAMPAQWINSTEALVQAMATARAGEVLELAPGSYTIRRRLYTANAGQAGRPIVLRAVRPGSVELVVTTVQAVVVSQPFWVFENLTLRGACANQGDCEHAFHVVGAARSTVIRNNRVVDFNAGVKINGEDGHWPDDGLLQFNTLTAREARRTEQPVNVVDLVGANGWQIVDNRVERFIHAGGNQVSYGICVKGGGRLTRIERNLVVCSPERISMPGSRFGISLGCGSTGAAFCRDGRCEAEQFRAVVANNVVAHCNNFGIDFNKAAESLIAHNTLVNTAGIDLRQPATSAVVVGNLLEGRIRARDEARLDERDNKITSRLDTLLAAPDALDLRWEELSSLLRNGREVETDFCARKRPRASPPGATLQASCENAEAAAARP